MLPSCGTLWVLYGFCICMGLWLWDFYEAVCHWGPGHHHSANKIELLPYVVALWALAFIHIYICIYIPNSCRTTTRAAASAAPSRHFTSLVLVIRYRPPFGPKPPPPPFTSTHILPIFSRASPDFSHLPTCWTFVTVLALAVHQAAVAAVRLTHNLQNNLNPPTQSRIPAPRWKTASLPRRGPSLSHSVSRLGECVNCLV